jgi:transposase
MSTRFVSIDRDTPILFPPALRDWVKQDDPVQLVLSLVEALPSHVFQVNELGSGSRQYPLSMMLALLVYCYSKSIFSSRRIEQATCENVSVRYLTGGAHPDHDTIAILRRNNAEGISRCFVQALVYASEMGLLKQGSISVDGMLIRANAGRYRNVRHDELDAVQAHLAEEVAKLLEMAEAADSEDSGAARLPEELQNHQALQEKVRQAREKIEAREQQKRHNKRATSKRFRGGGKGDGGRDPRGRKEGQPTPKPQASANLSDVDSRLMRRDNKSAFQQCFNAQAVADADGTQLILATHIADAGADNNELLPDVEAVPQELGEFTAILADSGFANREQVEAFEAKGKDVYISVRSEHRPRHPQLPASTNSRALSPLAKSSFGQRMRDKLATEEGKVLYKRRRQSIEACFGLIKHNLKFRQFRLRGLHKVDLEWNLVALAYNIRIIWNANNKARDKKSRHTANARLQRLLHNITTKIQSQVAHGFLIQTPT